MQWRKNRVAIGAITFVALLGFTIWAIRGRDSAETGAEVGLPTIEVEKDTITALEITRPGTEKAEAVVLTDVDGDWRVTVPLDAEADQNNVESALNRLTTLDVTGVVATRPENYPRLEVDDERAIKVVVRRGDEPPLDLRLGIHANGATMVRIGDRPEVFSVNGSIRYSFDRDLRTWRNRRITEAATQSVREITFESENGSFSFVQQDDGWAPVKNQKPIKEFDPKKVEGLVSTAARLTATDFAPDEVSGARAGFNEPEATILLTVAAPAPEDAEAEAAPVEPETITLEIGHQTDKDSEFYLRRADDETIYIISKYLAERLQPDAQAFKKSAEPPPTQQVPAPAGVASRAAGSAATASSRGDAAAAGTDPTATTGRPVVSATDRTKPNPGRHDRDPSR